MDEVLNRNLTDVVFGESLAMIAAKKVDKLVNCLEWVFKQLVIARVTGPRRFPKVERTIDESLQHLAFADNSMDDTHISHF